MKGESLFPGNCRDLRSAFRRSLSHGGAVPAPPSAGDKGAGGDGAPPLPGSWAALQIRRPSPPKPLRGQADRRPSQQKQAADRGPPSSVPRPRKSPGRGQSPFLVSAPGGKNPNHFSSRRVRDEKSLSRSDAQNAVQSPSGSAGGALAIATPKGRRRGAPGKRRRPPPLPGLSSAERLRRFTDDSHARYDPRTPGRPGRRRSRRCGRC